MKRRMSVIITCIIIVATLFSVSACGTSTPSSTKASSSTTSQAQTTNDTNERGYIYKGPQSVIYMQWTSDSSGNITGQLQEVYTTPNSYTVNVDSTSIKGVISGSNITITLENTGHTFTGNLSGSILTQNIPNDDGTFQIFTFKPGSVNQYNKDAQQFKTSISKQQAEAAQSQAETQLLNIITQLQNSVQEYHDAASNPKHWYPTFFAYGNSAGKVPRLNQPTSSYAAEIDLNAVDNKEHPLGQVYVPADAPWQTSIPKDGEYFGVTSNGIVFATSTPPDTQPDDATQGLNEGNSGDGGWSNNNIQVYVTSGMPNVLKTTSLSSLEQ